MGAPPALPEGPGVDVLNATLITDPELGPVPKITQQTGLITGVKSWRVPSADPLEAILAVGVPVRGNPFDPVRAPTLTARVIDTDLIGGEWTRVTVQYATREGGGGTINPPVLGSLLTEFESEESSVIIYHDPTGVIELPYNNGQGVEKLVPIISVRVSKWVLAANYEPTSFISFMGKVNKQALVLPNIHNTGRDANAAPGMLLYRGLPETTYDGELVRMTHIFSMAADFKARWNLEDEAGNATATVIEGEVYKEADMRGFW